jgi:hypothetical protein
MAAEIADGRETDRARQALAVLLAAQLSVLVGVEPARAVAADSAPPMSASG